jgi:hypothetical protein
MSALPMPNIWGMPMPQGGAFGLTDDDKKQALNMGLLAAGAGILAGNRGNYGRAGPAIGQGLLSGLQTYQGMQQMARQQKRQDFNDQMQFGQFQLKADEAAREKKRREQMDAALNDPNATEIFGIPAAEARQLYAIGGPDALTKAAASRYESYTLSPGAARFSGGQKIAEVAPENKIAPNGVVYDPRGIKPGQIFNDPNNLMFVGSDGMPVVNRALVGVKKDIARSGATNVSVAPKVEVKTGESLASQIGPMMKAGQESASGAIRMVDSSNRILDALDSNQLYAGPMANQRLSLAQIGDTIGIAGPNTQAKIQNTRQAIRALAEQAVAARSQLGGQAQISNAEQELLNKATAGDISELTPSELRMLADLSIRQGSMLYENYQQRLKAVQDNPDYSGMSTFYQVPPLPVRQPRQSGGWSIKPVGGK